MKRLIGLLWLALVSANLLAQKPKVQWGEEFKLRKGSTDLEVIYSDKSGVYLEEGHMAVKSYFVIGATARESATLVKLDKNLSELYRNDFNKELKGKEFVQFFVLQDKLFIFGSDYDKREKVLHILAAEVNKNTGELSGDWLEVTSFQKEEKRDDINFKIDLNADSSKMIIVSTIEGRERNEYQVQEFDKSMKASSKPLNISNEFDPKTFQLEDVLYTINKKVILVGRIYEYQEGKKKKDKFLDFVNYSIRLYNEQGKMQSEIKTTVNGKWLSSTKLMQEKSKDLILAAFYSNNKKGRTIDGLLVQRINPMTGEVTSTSEKEINFSLLTNDNDAAADTDEDEKETKAERKEREALDKIKDEGEAFSRYMQFRKVFYTSDNGIVILAEKYHFYTYTTQSYSPGMNGSPGRWSSQTYGVYECGDMMACKIEPTGSIGWMQVFPKSQREVISMGSSYGSGISFSSGYFIGGGRPFYAGFGALQSGGSIHLFFNDNPKNAVVTQPGQKVKLTNRFGKSDCFTMTIDEVSGKYARKMLFSNIDIPTSMPRLGSVVDAGMYIVGKEDRIFGKSKIAVGRISVK